MGIGKSGRYEKEVMEMLEKLFMEVDVLGLDDNDSNGDNDPIPVQNVSTRILKKVISRCQYHYQDTAPADDQGNREKRTDDIASWDAEFLKVDQGTLSEIILAANYMDIKGLLDVTCKAVANMIKGKSPDEIRRTLNIKNDFTPDEEEQPKKEENKRRTPGARIKHKFELLLLV
ncbi:hypothetical protein L3Y34_003216 [Caenorhabditis briggsae]|uniref:Skp1-related protein n=1 Tax=Caenorhabditis briggsae TaxID=6238 RepID=A0AAE9ABX8_CAEBR|nr:hypothetical protein L3Y34_003216 [Caenorhabditis briggsae]